jgi:APA family basic amino acid/polyamine antiporter
MSGADRADGADRNKSFGLPTATALVIGSIIGTGVFALPSALAPYGPIALIAFVVVTVGALALAVTFGALSRRVPGSGGPYVYAREAFGEFAGFLTAWSYWITAWAGNAAIVVAWVGYVEVFVNKSHHTWASILIALVGLWLPAAVNLSACGTSAPSRWSPPS